MFIGEKKIASHLNNGSLIKAHNLISAEAKQSHVINIPEFGFMYFVCIYERCISASKILECQSDY